MTKRKLSNGNTLLGSVFAIAYNGSRLGEVAEQKTSLELQTLKFR